jgi:pimeloyl-ACP methyl ester carboxylesterase
MTTYRTIDVNGGEIFCREGGDRSEPTLLLLHGFPSSLAQFEQLMGRLAGSCHVIAPDSRPSGPVPIWRTCPKPSCTCSTPATSPPRRTTPRSPS